MLLSTFFFAAAHFHLGISHFLTTAIKFSCFSSNKIDLFCFFISFCRSFSVFHVNEDIRIKSKERIVFVVVVVVVYL